MRTITIATGLTSFKKACFFLLLGITYPILQALFPSPGNHLIEYLAFLAGASQRVAENLEGLVDLVSTGCLLLGICFLVSGWWKGRSNKQPDTKGNGAGEL